MARYSFNCSESFTQTGVRDQKPTQSLSNFLRKWDHALDLFIIGSIGISGQIKLQSFICGLRSVGLLFENFSRFASPENSVMTNANKTIATNEVSVVGGEESANIEKSTNTENSVNIEKCSNERSP